MRILGLLESDIQYPSEATLNLYSRDPEFRKMVRNALCSHVDELVTRVKAKRDSLKKSKSLPQKQSKSDISGTSRFLEEEARKIALAERREIQGTLVDWMVRVEINRETAEREERERQRLRARDAELEKKRKQSQKAHQEKIRQLEKLEHDKQQLEKEQREKYLEKELQTQQRLEEEKAKKEKSVGVDERRRIEQAAAAARRLEELYAKRAEEIEKREKEAERREVLWRERAADKQKKLAEIRMRRRAELEEQLRRAREEKEAEIEARRLAAEERMMKADEAHSRAEDIIAARRRQMALKIETKSAQSLVVRQQLEEQKVETARVLVQEDEEKHAEFQKQREVQERDRLRQALVQRLRREKRASTALIAERQREAEKVDAKVKFDLQLKRIEAHSHAIATMRAAAVVKKKRMETGMEDSFRKIAAMQSGSRDNSAFIREVAETYGLDVDKLRERVDQRRRLRSLPKLNDGRPSLHGEAAPKIDSTLEPIRATPPARKEAAREPRQPVKHDQKSLPPESSETAQRFDRAEKSQQPQQQAGGSETVQPLDDDFDDEEGPQPTKEEGKSAQPLEDDFDDEEGSEPKKVEEAESREDDFDAGEAVEAPVGMDDDFGEPGNEEEEAAQGNEEEAEAEHGHEETANKGEEDEAEQSDEDQAEDETAEEAEQGGFDNDFES
jgi:hypothetical protein